MKSGVAAFVTACIALAGRLASSPGITLLITAGEEIGCTGAEALAAAGLDPVGALIVAEPTGNKPLVGHKGALWLEAETKGVAAHGSMPEKGINAIYKATRAVAVLQEFDFNVARHEVLGAPTFNVGTIQGGLNINSVPDRALIGIDIRTIPAQDHAQIREQLSSYLGPDVYLLSQGPNLCLERCPRPEQIDERPTNKSAKIPHPTTGLPDSRSTASRTRFATGTAVVSVSAGEAH